MIRLPTAPAVCRSPLLAAVAAALVLAWLPRPGNALQAPDYAALPEAKALAQSTTRPDTVRGQSHSQPHLLAASVQAMERCREQASRGETCEIVMVDDRRVTTAAEILARVPEEPHPLFLWRYARGATTLYLAGSIHVLKPSLYPLPPQLEEAFELADVLVVEVDIASATPGELARSTRAHGLLPHPQTLEDVLPADLHRRLERRLAAFGMTTDMLSPAKPAMVMNQVLVWRLLTLGYLPEAGVEFHFLSRRGDRRVIELESLDAQLALLFGQPLDTQIGLLEESLELEDEVEPILADLLAAWLSGDDGAFLEAFRAQTGDSPPARTFIRQLLDERNAHMSDRIASLLETPRGEPVTYFALVGTAHLVGEAGIVRRLARQGLVGQQVYSDDSLASPEAPAVPASGNRP